ncbi:MAG: hypothetical protein AAF985_11935 [Bacteroidota bacterium]
MIPILQKLLLSIALFLGSAYLLIAQIDAHYWTHQYGAKGLLLNGAVIASTDDETAVFYNPGAMGMGNYDDFSLSLSFLTPSYSVLRTTNYLGEGTTVTDREIGLTPGLAAIGFSPFGSSVIRAAITSFTRYKSNIRFRGRVVNRLENTEDLLFVGNLEFERKLSEQWVGFGMSVRMTDYLSFGFSQFMTFHGQTNSFSVQKELINSNAPDRLIAGWRNRLRYSFSANGGMLTKFGLAFSIQNRTKVGITLTTPTYQYLLRSANYEFDDLKVFPQDSTVLSSNLDGARLIDHKTPLSIGFGMDFPINRSRVSFSMEYFKAIERYTVIQDVDDPFNGEVPVPTDSEVLIENGNRWVFNFALGVQTKLSERSTLIWGFRTDFNQRETLDESSSLQFLSTTPSVYHISIGNARDIWNSRISFGVDYGFGFKKGNSQLVDFSNVPVEDLYVISGDGNVRSTFHSLVFILAYDFTLRKNKEE